MKKLLRASKRFISTMDLSDMALLKLCLVSYGILIGLLIPSKSKKALGLLMGILFCGTYIPLISKLYPALKDRSDH